MEVAGGGAMQAAVAVAAGVGARVPRVISPAPTATVLVFDLDGTVWSPDMYMLWGGGGPPFAPHPSGDMVDRQGTRIRVLGALRDILTEIDAMNPRPRIGIASSTDEPGWARELLDRIVVTGERRLISYFDPSLIEIYKAKGNKRNHLAAIARKTGAPLGSIVFLDNEYQNIESTRSIGVSAVHTPEGLTADVWRRLRPRFSGVGGAADAGML